LGPPVPTAAWNSQSHVPRKTKGLQPPPERKVFVGQNRKPKLANDLAFLTAVEKHSARTTPPERLFRCIAIRESESMEKRDALVGASRAPKQGGTTPQLTALSAIGFETSIWTLAGGPAFHACFLFPVPELWVPRPRAFCEGGYDTACSMRFVMPSGLHRTYGAHHLHFITCSCYRRLPFLGAAPSRDRVLSILEQARQHYRFVVVGYVVMPEHIHLLITEPEIGTPSTVMQVLKQRTAHALLPRRKRRKPTPAQTYWQTNRSAAAFGRHVFTTSMYGQPRSGWRSSDIYTEIQSTGDWWKRLSNGCGAVIVSIYSVRLVPCEGMRAGRKSRSRIERRSFADAGVRVTCSPKSAHR
jgi:REP element-mobilizing transposase RayT